MRFKLAAAIAMLGIGFAGAAAAQDDPIAARQEAMKNNGAAMRAVTSMVRGQAPYDAAGAAAAMKTIQDDMAVFLTLFPEGSDAGDTDAAASIWTDRAGFEAAGRKLIADAGAAEQAAAGGLEAFRTAFSTAGANCSACHQVYRD